jgi:hypothetical protein
LPSTVTVGASEFGVQCGGRRKGARTTRSLHGDVFSRNGWWQAGETPFTRYNYVLLEVWEVFVRQKQTPEVKAKSEQFSELAKRNQHHHHLGMIGYATKKP